MGNLHWGNDSRESHCVLQEVTGKDAAASGLNDSTTKQKKMDLSQENNTPSEVLSGGPGLSKRQKTWGTPELGQFSRKVPSHHRVIRESDISML